MRSTTLQLTLRRIHGAFTTPKVLGGLAVAAVLLGVSGPFQTFEAICTFTIATGFFAAPFAELALERRLSEWPRFAVASLTTASGAERPISRAYLPVIKSAGRFP